MKFLLILFLTFFSGVALAAKTFVYCSEGSPSNFNPQVATDGTTFNAASRTIYNRLVDFAAGTTEIVPSLAESWTVSEDGLLFTFKLRKNVPFHKTKFFEPTRKFNADDVLFSFHRMMDSKHPYHKVGGGSYEYYGAMDMDKILKEVKKVDAHTVQFILKRKEAPFLANMAMDFAAILSAEYGTLLMEKGSPEEIDWMPVGTGPFQFKKYSKDTLIRYTANDKYFEGRPSIENLIYSITKDPTVRTQKLKAGECDFITQPAFTDLNELKKHKDIEVLEQEGLNVGYLAMNVQKKPFDNLLVRQAVNHALNRESYIKAIYFDNATIAKNPIPPSMWSYNKTTSDYEYNVAKAKELLKKAGYENGFESEIWVLPVSRPYNPNGKKMGELMQADLAKVGIKVKLVQYDWPTYLEKSKHGEHKMIQLGWTGDNGDPDNFLNVLLGCEAVKAGANRARWCDEKFEQLVTAGKTSTDKSKRTGFYKDAQKRFKEKAPWVTLAHAKVFRAYRKGVVGYKIDPFGRDILFGVDKK